MTRAADATRCSCSPTATTFEGEADRRTPTTRRRSPAGEVVFNTALVGLPGDRHRPVVRGADHHLHLPAHRQLRRQRRRRREPPPVLPRRDRARPRRAARATGARPAALDDFLDRHGVPGIAGIDTRRLTRHLRDAGRAARRVRHRRGRGARRGRRGRRGTDGIDLVAERHHRPSRTRSATTTRRSTWSRTTSGSSARSSHHLVGAGCQVEVVPGVDARGRGARPRARRRVPLERARRPGRGDRRHRRGARRCSARCRCSASASATRSSASRSAPTPSSCRFGHHGGNHPVRHVATGRVEITSQNHNYAVDADSLAGGVERHPREPQRRRASRACACRDAPRVQRAVPPRGRARPARRRATCSTSSPTLMDASRADRCRSRTDLEIDPAHRQRADRHRPGVRVRLLGHPGVPRAARRGLPRRARELEPGDDHDRPRVRRRDLRRAARRRDPHAASSSGSAPTRCCRRSAARPRSTSRSSSHEAGVLDEFGVELIGASVEAIHTAEDRQRFKAAMTGDRAARSRSRASRTRSTRRCAVGERGRLPGDRAGPSFILGGGGTGIAHDADEMRDVADARPRREPDLGDPDRAVGRRAGRSTSSR